MNNKIRLYISNWIYSDFLIEILRLGLGAMWMISLSFCLNFGVDIVIINNSGDSFKTIGF